MLNRGRPDSARKIFVPPPTRSSSTPSAPSAAPIAIGARSRSPNGRSDGSGNAVRWARRTPTRPARPMIAIDRPVEERHSRVAVEEARGGDEHELDERQEGDAADPHANGGRWCHVRAEPSGRPTKLRREV